MIARGECPLAIEQIIFDVGTECRLAVLADRLTIFARYGRIGNATLLNYIATFWTFDLSI
jgi:hypothetical protein